MRIFKNKLQFVSILTIVFIFLVFSTILKGQTLVSYVDPFIGTGGHGHTFPGATAPFGMIQLSPDTRLTGWDGCSGYHYTDTIIYGFSHTHLSGTGVSDYGDVLLMPGVGLPLLRDYEYASPFEKTTESAEPGYYRVVLKKSDVEVELTCTPRAGFHQYHFPQSTHSYVVLDLVHRDPVLDASIQFISDRVISGHRRSKAWAEDQVIYFYLEFSQPFKECGTYSEGKWRGGGFREIEHPDLRSYFAFDTDGEIPLLIKIGISAVDIEGARKNLYSEIPDWGFEKTKMEVQSAWEKALNKIQISDNRDSLKTIFYTALYHTMIHPNIFVDVDGRYRGMDKKIHQAQNHTPYTVFSLWDTYRALHPLYNIINRKQNRDFIHSMLDIYEKGGLLPVWELAANETFCMIGYHSASVIVDAWAKGVKDFNANVALQAMQYSAEKNHFGLASYKKYGHIPGDKDHESVSKTLEYVYDDWCISQLAYSLKRSDIYQKYTQRAQYYKNIYDPSTSFMRPRINGAWKTPFDPAEVDFHFTEANSWQYSFYVPHDVKGLIDLYGSEAKFEHQLDELFSTTKPVSGRHQSDITGLIGQYAHGNEPSHHMAYLYNYIGKPWKTQERVRQIILEQYSTNPDGLSGNEDCGQMSAWYIMSALGFYPVCPGSTHYIAGAPIFHQATVNLENGKNLVILAHNQSEENKYVNRIRFNKKEYTQSWFEHDDIMLGGVIEFFMADQPNVSFGNAISDRPLSAISDHLIEPNPWFSKMEKSFVDSFHLELNVLNPEHSTIFYQKTDSTWLEDQEWFKYEHPIIIQKKQKIKAKSINRNGVESKIVEAEYIPLKNDLTVNLKSKYSSQYSAGGPQALVDGIRGELNWRLGGWQGFQGQDFEAIIDLGFKKSIKQLGAGFAQDIRSWIWMPTEVIFQISNDGKKFKTIATVKNSTLENDYELSIHDFVANVISKGRYLKVIAKNYGTIPEWHLGSGGKSYIFIDEIWVK
jgi:predicted alpha-1,2-mannosidase